MITINVESSGDNTKFQITSVTRKLPTKNAAHAKQVADSHPAPKSSRTDASGLAEALRREIRGGLTGKFASTTAAAPSTPTDGSSYRQVPIGVVIPRDADDVIPRFATCREHNAPVLSRGGGTSLAGQCCNVAVVLDFSKYLAKILEIDPARRIARVQPGVILDHLRNAAEKHHLTFAPDPATHDRCTLGGMIGNNSCGVHSVMAGKTDDNIEALDILTYDGVRMKVGADHPDSGAEHSRQRPSASGAAAGHRAASDVHSS